MDWYPILKSIHVIGVILFVGNIAITGWWKAMADRTRDPRILAFAQRQVTLTDWVFTLGGIVLLAVSGALSAIVGGFAPTTPWLQWGSAPVHPLGRDLGCRPGAAADQAWGAWRKPSPSRARSRDQYWKLERLWVVFGVIATVLPLATVVVMVLKSG